VIRQATPDDAEAVAEVQVRSWQAAYDHVLPRDRLVSLSVVAGSLTKKNSPPLVAQVDEEIVGFVAVGSSRDAGGDGELYAIYVRPERWGTGVGRALIEAGEARLRQLGHGHASLWVLEDNPRARGFYEAAGWSTDGTTRPIEIFGILVPEIRYEKKLA